MLSVGFRALVAAALLAGAGADAQTPGEDCGNATPCTLDNGFYHAALPEVTIDAPVVLWLHGYGGRAERAARPRGMALRFIRAGFVFVAPQGIPDPGQPDRRDWNVRDGHDRRRDDVGFLSAVLDDVAARFGTNPDRVLLAGFSRGASMAWDYACATPDRIAGLAAVAGGFWEPMRPDCAGPVQLFHTHGFKDRMVPLEGRKVTWNNRSFHQGNIMKGLDIWRETNGCTGAADKSTVVGSTWEKRWTNCDSGSIRLRITPKGHGIPKGWSQDVLDWFGDIAPTRG